MIAKGGKWNKEKEKLLTHSSWDQVITAVFAAVRHEDHGHYLYQNPGNWCVPDYQMPISNKTCYYSYPKQTWSKLHQAHSEHDPFAATHCKQNWYKSIPAFYLLHGTVGKTWDIIYLDEQSGRNYRRTEQSTLEDKSDLGELHIHGFESWMRHKHIHT